MSRQINFYLTEADQIALEQRLLQAGPLLAIGTTSPNEELATIQPGENGVADLSHLVIYLVRPDDVSKVGLKSVPAQGYFSVDQSRSPVVELLRSRRKEDKLQRGRIYAQTSHYGDDGNLISREESFLQWLSKLLYHARKTLIREDGVYVGPDAYKKRDEENLRFMVAGKSEH